MLITLVVDGQLLPIIAPVGAAGYHMRHDSDTRELSIIFAMMKENETGLDALRRVRKDQGTIEWSPVDARPIEQHHLSPGPEAFIAYEFKEADGAWIPTTKDQNTFFEQMTRLSAIPAKAPDSMHTSVAEWSARRSKVAV